MEFEHEILSLGINASGQDVFQSHECGDKLVLQEGGKPILLTEFPCVVRWFWAFSEILHWTIIQNMCESVACRLHHHDTVLFDLSLKRIVRSKVGCFCSEGHCLKITSMQQLNSTETKMIG